MNIPNIILSKEPLHPLISQVGLWTDLLQFTGFIHCWCHDTLSRAQARTALQPYFWNPPGLAKSTVPLTMTERTLSSSLPSGSSYSLFNPVIPPALTSSLLAPPYIIRLFILLQCSMNTFVKFDWSNWSTSSFLLIIPYQIWQSNFTFLIKFNIEKMIDIIIGYRIYVFLFV